MNTPTPRTDAAWASSFNHPVFSSAHTARTMRDECAELERELAAERETSRLLKVAMDVRDEGYTQSRRRMSALESEVTAKGQAVRNLAEVITGQDKELEYERAKVRALRSACERLRDCDWTITLPDRMDAVRDIARAALAATEDAAPKSDRNAPKLNQTGANRPALPRPS